MFKGYFENTGDTTECFDEDGWFHSGDIGQWNEVYHNLIDDTKTLRVNKTVRFECSVN